MDDLSKVVSFRLTGEGARALARLARLERRPVSEVLRRLVEREALRSGTQSAAAKDRR